MKRSRKLLLISLGIPVICVLLIAGLVALAVLTRSDPVFDYDDPESLWELAECTERYIVQTTDRGSSARKEALKVLEDIALLEVSEEEKARLIRERFPEESFWTEDLKALQKQAESGDAEAQFQLGCFYSLRQDVRASDADLDRGKCVMKSHAMAYKWFRKAAQQGHAKAQSRIVRSMFFGHPAYKNVEDVDARTLTPVIEKTLVREADDWQTKAAMQGDPDALCAELGSDEDEERNRRTALAIFREAAEQGDVEAMLSTASLLEYFDDFDGAAEWYRKAAELGNVSGMVSYAEYREKMMEPDDEDTVPKDWEWRQKAYDAAMKQLDEGSARGIRKVRELSVPVFLERLTGGESEEAFAARVMPRLWELIERHGDYEDAPQVIRHLMGIAGLDYGTLDRLFAELGMYLYQKRYADHLLDSDTPAEQAEGVRLLRKLAGFSYLEARRRLAKCYLEGTGVPKDKAEGVRLLRTAAGKGDVVAMRLLSNCLRTGDPPKNWFEALRWELRADTYSTHYDSVPEYVIHQVKNAAENAWDDLRRR
jgi:TPR repeat protein